MCKSMMEKNLKTSFKYMKENISKWRGIPCL